MEREVFTFIGNEDDYYLVFVLGYDLLQKDLYKIPCDDCFNICKDIIKWFYKSEEIHDFSMSTYQALEEFITNNQNDIDCMIDEYLEDKLKDRRK